MSLTNASRSVQSDLRLVGRALSAGAELDHLGAGRIAAVISLARTHRVEAWLAELAPRTGAWEELHEQRLRFIAARARTVAELRRFRDVAQRADTAWLCVKGAALAEDLYPKPHMRHGVDVDTLVPAGRFAELRTALLADGWEELDRNWPLLADTMPAQLKFRSPLGGLHDVHWNLMNTPALRRDFPFETDVLLSRKRILPSGLPTLHPADQLAHLAVHGALSGGNRLIWLLDVTLSAARITDWPQAREVVGRAGAEPALGLMLARAHRWLPGVDGRDWLDPTLPSEVEAVPNARSVAWWGAACRLTDRLSPLNGDPERPAMARSLARSARETPLRSVTEFGRHLAEFVRSGASRSRPPSPIGDVEDPRSPAFPIEDPLARERYLRAARNVINSSSPRL